MAEPLSNVSGLSSGIQWADLIDQTIAAERQRSVGRVETRISEQEKRKTAWTSFQDLVTKFRDAAKALRDGTAFGTFGVAVGASGATGRTLFAATAAATAQPGSYKVQVDSLARAEKLSGGVVASATTALGISGDIVVNGRTLTLQATDTLTGIRDRINAANSGTTATRVTASVLSSGAGQYRLVLAADEAGSTGITLGDGSTGALRELGLVDTRSRSFGSVGTSIAALLGIMTPPAQTTLRVGGKTIQVDVSVDTLSSIQAKIAAVGVESEVVTEVLDGTTSHRLAVSANVQGMGDADGDAVVAMLGLAAGERSAVRQAAATTALTDGASTATTASRLVDLGTGGTAAGIAAGDVVVVRGTRGDGSAVNVAVTVGADTTMADLLARLNTPADAASFGGGTRPATASLTTDGSLRVVDGTGGESRLGFTLSVVKPDGSSSALAAVSTASVGRRRELVDGSDAQVRVDGVPITRATNTITDAIAGVSLTLSGAEPGVEVDLTVTRDDAATLKAVKDFAAAYNAIVDFSDKQRVVGQPLYASSVLRGAISTLTTSLRTEVAGTGDLTRLSNAGVALSRTGRLEVNDARVNALLAGSLTDFRTLVGSLGVGKAGFDAADAIVKDATGTVALQLDSITDSITSLKDRKDAMEQRLEVRRSSLMQQYTRMEEMLASLNSQGTFLTNQVKMMTASR